jgi:hypothetical protein
VGVGQKIRERERRSLSLSLFFFQEGVKGWTRLIWAQECSPDRGILGADSGKKRK